MAKIAELEAAEKEKMKVMDISKGSSRIFIKFNIIIYKEQFKDSSYIN